MKLSHVILTSAIVITLGLAGCGTTNTTNSTSTTNNTNPTEQKVSQEKTNPTSSGIKAGVTNMLSVTADLKTAITAGDEAKVKTIGPKLEEAWQPFEDKVKEKYPDSYKKVEQFLDPTIAGTKAGSLDKQALGKLTADLTDALNELAAKEKIN